LSPPSPPAKIGAVVAAVTTFSTPRELAWALEHSGAAALITLDAFRGRRFLDVLRDPSKRGVRSEPDFRGTMVCTKLRCGSCTALSVSDAIREFLHLERVREAKPSVSASDPCENSHFWPFPRSICMPLPAKPLAVAARNGGFVAAADREHRGADPRENGEMPI
jgi:hypothetical protein